MPPRPKLEDPEVRKVILDAIDAGNYRQTAAAAAGVHRNSLYVWERKAEAGEEPYASFMHDLMKAEAQAEIKLLAEIRNAQPAVTGQTGADVWTAKAWILERRFPARFCARVKREVTEQIDLITSKIRAKPELHQQVLDAIDSEGPTPPGPTH